jgi:hypothetical protein
MRFNPINLTGTESMYRRVPEVTMLIELPVPFHDLKRLEFIVKVVIL